MEYIDLTPFDQEELDPTGKARAHLRQYNADRFTPSSPYYRVNITENLDRWRNDQSHGGKHSFSDDYAKEMQSKVGPQGGTCKFEELQAILETYYDTHDHCAIPRLLYRGRDYFIRYIKGCIDRYGYPQIMYKRVDGASASLPSMAHKGEWLSEVYIGPYFRHPMANLPGIRKMRNSIRAIFMDPVRNVRYIEQELNAVKKWLVKYTPWFIGWENPILRLKPQITQSVDRNKYFVEWDYKSMDKNMQFDNCVAELILPIYETLIPGSYLSFASFVEELYQQPVYLGDRMLTGKHGTFSGQAITNDFETIYTVILALGAALEMGQLNDLSLVAAMGDDATLAFSTFKTAERAFNYAYEASNAIGMQIHPLGEKSAIRHSQTRFCRLSYYPGAVRNADGIILGSYPESLALNSIYNVEFSAPSEPIAAIADIQRLDTLHGNPHFTQVVQYVASKSTHKFAKALVNDPAAIQYVSSRDWWFKVYGSKWSPDSSPAILTLQRSGFYK